MMRALRIGKRPQSCARSDRADPLKTHLPLARSIGRPRELLTKSALAIALALLFAVPVSAPSGAGRDTVFGAYGPEGPRLREQLWILPSGDPNRFLRATVFRPDAPPGSAASEKRPLVVINHGTSDLTRMAVSMPVFYWLSRWFVERGYVVVLPQRRGHGATGGPLAEAVGTCAKPDHFASGQVAADDVEAVVGYMTQQPFIAPSQTIVVGISTGGWASLALASRNPANVRAVVNFAGGRGGHAGGQPNVICGKGQLIEAAHAYGSAARVPTIWLYSRNDSYFSPDLAKQMAAAWSEGGGLADLHVLPSYRTDGHDIADDRAGWDIWGPAVERFLDIHTQPLAVVARSPGTPGMPPPQVSAVSSSVGPDAAPAE
jgi:dienelactone hydrolase